MKACRILPSVLLMTISLSASNAFASQWVTETSPISAQGSGTSRDDGQAYRNAENQAATRLANMCREYRDGTLIRKLNKNLVNIEIDDSWDELGYFKYKVTAISYCMYRAQR